MPTYDYLCKKCGIIEISHSILENFKTICPLCHSKIEKQISSSTNVVVKGREANQYADIKHAGFWRDKNGIKHRVRQGDGHSGAPTISKQTVSPEQLKLQEKIEKKMGQQRRLKEQAQRANRQAKRKIR